MYFVKIGNQTVHLHPDFSVIYSSDYWRVFPWPNLACNRPMFYASVFLQYIQIPRNCAVLGDRILLFHFLLLHKNILLRLYLKDPQFLTLCGPLNSGKMALLKLIILAARIWKRLCQILSGIYLISGRFHTFLMK